MRNMCSFLLLVVLTFTSLTQSFKPFSVPDSISMTHRDITERAILQKTAEVCRYLAAAEKQDFSLSIDDKLTIEQVHEACSSYSSDTSGLMLSSHLFSESLWTMHFRNGLVDSDFLLIAARHFDNEAFREGRNIITQGVFNVKANVRTDNFMTGRLFLGYIFHTLQDFYSHSNWVELGNTAPYRVLIEPDQPLENLAGPIMPTCRNCNGDNCDDNLVSNVLLLKRLTSGYFSPFSSEKPRGKCSHGGDFDLTSLRDPVGGINKEHVKSRHGSLHFQAANLAVTATMQLLEDIRLAGGDRNFLRLMGLSHSSALCFVIDTTRSMGAEINEARRVTFELIDRRNGTLLEPPAYILVPFNDPDVGPPLMTTDAETIKEGLNQLTPNGGGDNPEMSLSGLQLALTTAPSSTEIFVFTDASAKDVHLKSTITALIESTKSVVTFLLTETLSSRRKRVVTQEGAQLYRDLAIASGGQTIEVSKRDLPMVTNVIEDSTGSATVTVFQEMSSQLETFSFTLDSSLRNIIISITGKSSLTFILTSSTGVSQNSGESSGSLASSTSTGNLRRLRLNDINETGLWEIRIDSNDHYSVKVTGQSPVNFIYYHVEESEAPVADFFLKEARPLTGGNATIFVTATGSGSVNVTEVTLYDSSGPTAVNGILQSLGTTGFLVTFNEIPAGDFVVRLRGGGSDSSSQSTPSMFQRQAPTRIRTSNIAVIAQVNITNIEPGSNISIPFTVAIMTGGVPDETANGTFTMRAINNRNFNSSSPISVTVEADSGGKANDTVTLTAPANVTLGTDVTLTIVAENEDATDLNFAVLRFSVGAEVDDVTRPVCRVVRKFANCPADLSRCGSSQWMWVVQVTDGVDGTGIDSIVIREGTGTLRTRTLVGEGGEIITEASYQASCCEDRVELSVLDNVGNVALCMGRVSDVLPPMCQEVRTSTCPSSSSPCNSSQWVFVVNVSDSINGVGVDNVTIRVGNGTLNTTTVVRPGGENITVASYQASCCESRVHLSAMDKAGNEVICIGQAIRESTTVAPLTTTTNIFTGNGGHAFHTSHCLCIILASLALWK